MTSQLTELYMKFLREELLRSAPRFLGKGLVRYSASVNFCRDGEQPRSKLAVSGSGPRDPAFRMADIIKYHREKIWLAPVFILPEGTGGITVLDDIKIGSGVAVGELATRTADAIAIFVEKYLKRG